MALFGHGIRLLNLKWWYDLRINDVLRLAILALLQHGEECSCVLLEQLDLTQSGLSYHMKILCESGIVIGRPEGKWTFYHISPEGCQKAVEALLAVTNIL